MNSPPEWNVFDALPVPFMAVSDDDVVQYLNAAATRLLGAPGRRAIGRHWSDVVSLRDETGGAVDVVPSRLLGRCDGTGRDVWRWLRRDGATAVPVQLSVSELGAPNGDGSGRIGVVLYDQSGMQQLVERLAHRCAHDDLTGLVNRAEFEKRLAGAVNGARNGGHAHALCFMDLNEFKSINDRHGHLAGDEVLQHVANRLRALIRERDTLARLGGDEFALLLEHCTVEHAVNTARLMRFTLKQSPATWKQARVTVGISIGITPIDPFSADARAVLAAADAACYAAKREGYDSICVAPACVPAADPPTRA